MITNASMRVKLNISNNEALEESLLAGEITTKYLFFFFSDTNLPINKGPGKPIADAIQYHSKLRIKNPSEFPLIFLFTCLSNSRDLEKYLGLINHWE